MDERLRFVARLLEGEKMAVLCREFDISRKTGYKIFQRYQHCGVTGLTDRSRRPYRQANKLPMPIVSLIVQLKREQPDWGAPKIREKLRRRYSGIQTPAQPRVRCRRSEPAVGCRHDVHCHVVGADLPGHRGRRVEPAHRRLVDGPDDDRRPAHRSAGHGRLAAASARCDPSQRSGKPIQKPGVWMPLQATRRAAWAMPTTTRWLRAALPASSASYLIGARSRRASKRALRCSPGSRLGTTRAGATRGWGAFRQRSSKGKTLR